MHVKSSFLLMMLATATMANKVVVKLGPSSESAVRGVFTLVAEKGGVHLKGKVTGLAPNTSHGFHIHEKPDCSAPDASSAGGHWNPENKDHGVSHLESSASHAGDLGNIQSDASGVASVDLHLKGYTLGLGPLKLNAHSLVIHEKEDDLKSQPAGNAGKRIACGVIP